MIWIFIIPAAFLLIGIADMPIGYYTFFIIVVFISSGVIAYNSYSLEGKISFGAALFGGIALLSNPIFPVYLQDKEIWTTDIVSVVSFVGAGIYLKKKHKEDGVPYYLSLLDMDESLPEIIDRLFFSEDAPMRNEYRRLHRSVFQSPERYMDIVKALSANKSGLTRKEISEAVHIDSGSGLSEMLDDLVACDFIRSYRNGLKKNGEIYQLMDSYTLFYLQFCVNPSTDRYFWKNT